MMFLSGDQPLRKSSQPHRTFVSQGQSQSGEVPLLSVGLCRGEFPQCHGINRESDPVALGWYIKQEYVMEWSAFVLLKCVCKIM